LFCSRVCARRRHPPRFCAQCLDDTSAESTGNLSSVNGIGFNLLRVYGEKPCRYCGSEVVRVWFCIGFPIIPCSRYLVLWIDEPWFMGEGTFLARKLR
jgi:hypothetical protein